MAFEDVLVHTGTPVRRTGSGTWIEGEFVPLPEGEGTPFDCVLFLPQVTEDTQVVALGRRVVDPTLLYAPEDWAGAMIGLGPEDDVLVIAPELNVAQGFPEDREVRWQVLGDPQPFGRPGSDVIGFQATLRRVAE